ncbi:phage tail tube protein [Pseudomonas sp. NPDC086581]|uniref:phage tail tube protein n=1 Tax=Pseudomonas sp. NPDC086581 TaxID=3364432 RepID=UPI003823609A
MATQTALKSQFTKSPGTLVSISKLAATDPKAAGLTYANLSVTIKQAQYQGGQSEEIDVTTLACDTKEFTTGLRDGGTFPMSGHWKLADEAQTVLRAAYADGEPRAFKVEFKDGSKSYFLGLVTQFSWEANVSGTVSGSFAVRVTGAVTFEPAAA